MLKEHKWKVDVSAGSYYPSLTQSLHGNDLNLAFEDEAEVGMYFYAYSYHIDEIEDPYHVAARLFSLQLVLNGALRVSSANPAIHLSNPIKFSKFYNLDSGSSHVVYAESIEDNPFSSNEEIEKALSAAGGTYSPASHLVKLSKQDEDLRSLLSLTGLISTSSPVENILTWGTLYKILETVKQLSKENGLDINSFADQNDIQRFTAACNSMTVLGLAARHGKTGFKKPSQAMTRIDEAVTLIVALTGVFCPEYVRVKHS